MYLQTLVELEPEVECLAQCVTDTLPSRLGSTFLTNQSISLSHPEIVLCFFKYALWTLALSLALNTLWHYSCFRLAIAWPMLSNSWHENQTCTCTDGNDMLSMWLGLIGELGQIVRTKSYCISWIAFRGKESKYLNTFCICDAVVKLELKLTYLPHSEWV